MDIKKGLTLWTAIKECSAVSEDVIVMFSGGKDSVVTLDLCVKHFKRVHVVFMYLVPNLTFQESLLKYYEFKYSLSILRIPHVALSGALAGGYFRMASPDTPVITMNDIYDFVREKLQCKWIAAGERIADGIIRGAMIKKSGVVDTGRHRMYPVAHFNKAEILSYLKVNKLPYALESTHLGYSMRGLQPRDAYILREKYPEDFNKIREYFPFVDASAKNFEIQIARGDFDTGLDKKKYSYKTTAISFAGVSSESKDVGFKAVKAMQEEVGITSGGSFKAQDTVKGVV